MGIGATDMSARKQCDQKPRSSRGQLIESKVKATVYGHGRGWVFTPKGLASFGYPRSIGMA